MDKVSMQLALASAKANGDRETVRMIMSAMRVEEERDAGQPASGLLSGIDGGGRIGSRDAAGPREAEWCQVSSLLEKLLGGVLGGVLGVGGAGGQGEAEGEQEQAMSMDEWASRVDAENGPRMVVINGSTGEVVGGDDLPPEVLAAIKAMGLSEMGEGGDEDEVVEASWPSEAGPTRH